MEEEVGEAGLEPQQQTHEIDTVQAIPTAQDVDPQQEQDSVGVVEAEADHPVAEPPAAPTTPTDAVTPPAPPNPLLEKHDEHWNVVRENPADFQTWTLLISTTEKLEDIERLRIVFDSFLAEYPLCYGYWKKYADAEVRHGNSDVASHVFERGVSSIPYSVDLWGHYVTFKQNQQATADDIRSVFERGLAYVATDYNAHTLWDKYLQFEMGQSNTHAVAAIFSRILRSPLKELDRYYTSFKEFVAQQQASDLMSMEELLAHKAEIEKHKIELREKAKAAAEAEAAAQALNAAKAEVAVKAAEVEPTDPDAVNNDVKPDPDQVDIKADEGDGNHAKSLENGSTEIPADVDMADTAAEATPEKASVKDETEVAASIDEGNDGNIEPSSIKVAAADEEAQTETELIKAEQNGEAPAVDEQMGEGIAAEAVDSGSAVAAEAAAAAPDAPDAPDAMDANGDTDMMQVEQVAADAQQQDGDGAEATAEGHLPQAQQEMPIIVTEDEVKYAWMQAREELYLQTKEELAKRKPFEDQIKRPYFHVKALDAVQLNNWNRYLTFIETHGDEAAIITLYERCLVACASYPEFWQRYIRLMESINMDHATGALQRAVVIYCKRRPEVHLFAAHFEERHGNLENARRNFKYILAELSPRLLAAVTAAANFEARQGNEESAWSYFEDLIREEKAKENSKIYCHLCIQFANFLVQKYKRVEKAREVLADALEHSPHVRALWEASIFIEEISRGQDMVQRVLDLYNRCTEAPADPVKGLSVKDREELSQRSVEFADMYGGPQEMYEAEKAHAARFLLPSSVTQTKKRSAMEPASAMAAKVPRMDGMTPHPLPPPPAMGAPPGPPVPPPAAAAAGYYGQPPAAPAAAPAAAGYNYAAYYGQYQGYGYGYGY